MRIFPVVFLVLTALFLSAFGTDSARAQGVGSLFKAEATAEPDTEAQDRLTRILREAAESGVGVIVINTDGRVVSDGVAVPADGAAPAAEPSTLMKAQDAVVRFRTNLIERLLDLPNSFNEVAYILRATSPDGTIWLFVKVLLYSLMLFAVGMVVEIAVYGRRVAKNWVVARTLENPQGYGEKMPWLVFRFTLGIVGILVSMVVAYVLGVVFFEPLEDGALQFTVTLINIAYFLSRAIAQLWRMILSPYMAQYRIPRMSTLDAQLLYLWLSVLGGFDICRLLFVQWIRELGLNYDVYAFIGSLLGAVVVLLNIVMVLANRRAITNAIRQGQPAQDLSWAARTLSSIWAPVVVLYMLYAWGQVTYNLVLGNPPSIPLIAGAYAILLSILVVYGVINFGIERSFARARALRQMNADMDADEEEGEDLTGADADTSQSRALFHRPRAMTTYEDLARRVAGILAFVAGIYSFFHIWESKNVNMVEGVASNLLDVMVICFIGYVIYHAFRIWIDKKIAEEQGDMDEGELGDEGGGTSASRLATLLPLFRNFILILLLVTIVLIVLMELGVNVGPLFAGAGVVGVAVGFGSQALVRDIFSGGFFLFDDAFRKGEYLDVGGVKGTVEKISVRSFQLRHHLGALHTIPFGEIQVMTNYSRDWVIMKLPLRVTYDTDVEKVRKLIKKLGVELLDDPVIGDNFIQPLKSQGVIEMQDSAMIIRVKFMTKPGDQWLVRKKVYEEIRALFEREGIKFAHKEVTVRLADGKVENLSEDEKKAITSAAQASIEEDMMEGGSGDGDDR